MITKQLRWFGEVIGSAGLCMAMADQAKTWVGAWEEDGMDSDFWNLCNFMEVNEIKKQVDRDFFVFNSYSNQPFFVIQSHSKVFSIFADETSLAVVRFGYRERGDELTSEISFQVLE